MADYPWDEGSESVIRSEHISPLKTGDNIEAKRVAPYVWNGTEWQRFAPQSAGLITEPYDYIKYTNTSSTVDTYQYYIGGSSGTLQATITITFTDATKGQISTVEKS